MYIAGSNYDYRLSAVRVHRSSVDKSKTLQSFQVRSLKEKHQENRDFGHHIIKPNWSSRNFASDHHLIYLWPYTRVRSSNFQQYHDYFICTEEQLNSQRSTSKPIFNQTMNLIIMMYMWTHVVNNKWLQRSPNPCYPLKFILINGSHTHPVSLNSARLSNHLPQNLIDLFNIFLQFDSV